ncbi:hypothetical protein TcWFU_008154 [Taenia crassiceps]|uniref:Uncharacterized protein n=1 Tax=Taenia crassiceps TaxID=6207 RepID=A0ABR4QEQ9_9CEST
MRKPRTVTIKGASPKLTSSSQAPVQVRTRENKALQPLQSMQHDRRFRENPTSHTPNTAQSPRPLILASSLGSPQVFRRAETLGGSKPAQGEETGRGDEHQCPKTKDDPARRTRIWLRIPNTTTGPSGRGEAQPPPKCKSLKNAQASE